MTKLENHISPGFVKGIVLILNLNLTSLNFYESWSLTWYLNLVWQEVLNSNHLFIIYSSFIDLKVHEGIHLICLTLHVASRKGGCKRLDIHIKPKSYKLELLGKLVI